jgi:iron(III) transport system permease protein
VRPGGRSAWSGAAWLVAAGVLTPLAVVAASFLTPRGEIWAHLAATILPELTRNTIALVTGVALLAGALGASLAWLVTMHEFPGRAFFEWALVLPLAVPAYVAGFVWIALFEFSGPVASVLRAHVSPELAVPNVRSAWAATLVLALAVYPYTYLLTRAAFTSLSGKTLEAALGLGASRWRVFRAIALPLSRPAVAGGMTLAALETLSDFGTVSLFDVRTFTVGIYRVWFGMFDREAASQLASLLLAAAVVVVLLERALRGRRRFTQTQGRPAAEAWAPIGVAGRLLACASCTVVFLAAFAIPVAVLVTWSLGPSLTRVRPLWQPAMSSVVLSAGAASAACAVAVLLAYARRLVSGRPLRLAVDASALGYAMPGTVVAVGVLVVASALDGRLEWAAARLGVTPPDLLAGSVWGLLLAYLVRFIAVALHPLDSGLARVPPSLDEAAASLGARPGRIVRSIHLPLLATPLTAALLLVFMDVIKELPATMLMRPRGWDTLAVEVWQLTTESLWHEAALPSLIIVAASMPAAIVLIRSSRRLAWQR